MYNLLKNYMWTPYAIRHIEKENRREMSFDVIYNMI